MPGAAREASSGMGTGARDERLLWPWLHVTERASQGLRLHGGLRMAGALPRPSPSHWGTPSNRKRRRVTEPRTRTCRVQEASPGPGGLRPSRRESLTRDVHWEEVGGQRGRGGGHASCPPPRPSPSWPTTLRLAHLLLCFVFPPQRATVGGGASLADAGGPGWASGVHHSLSPSP